MRRRSFIALLGGALAGWPLTLAAQQQQRRPRLGILLYSTPKNDPNLESFLSGMRDLGWADRQSIAIEYRYAEGNPERLPMLAEELVRLDPNVLFALGGDVAPPLRKATQTIPIVYAMSADPVKLGIARTLARPGGNASGVTFLADELAAKRLELFKEACPQISRVGFLWNPEHADNELPIARQAAESLKLALHPMEMRRPGDLESAFSSAKQAGVDAIYAVSSRHTVANASTIIAYSAKNRLPLVGGWGAWVHAGALLSYGPNVGESIRNGATYVDKVLKGARVGELPVQQPERFELLINLKTARALDLSIPESFLLRADKVLD